MYETVRIVKDIKPKLVIWENVKGVLSKKHKDNFNRYITELNMMGYNNYYEVLNAKNYGIPQNRERIFVVSIRKDIDTNKFSFPKPIKLTRRLQDILEEIVDEKYFLSEKMQECICKKIVTEKGVFNNKALINKEIASTIGTKESSRRCSESNYIAPNITDTNVDLKAIRLLGAYDTEKRKHQTGQIFAKDDLSPTLSTMQRGNLQPCIFVKNNTKKGYLEAYEGDGVYTNPTTKRGTVQPQSSPTLTSFQDKGVVVKDEITNFLRIRKLTPKEYWRLMGFDDEDCEICSQNGISNTQLYKQAGNSIVVNVLVAIFEQLKKANII